MYFPILQCGKYIYSIFTVCCKNLIQFQRLDFFLIYTQGDRFKVSTKTAVLFCSNVYMNKLYGSWTTCPYVQNKSTALCIYSPSMVGIPFTATCVYCPSLSLLGNRRWMWAWQAGVTLHAEEKVTKRRENRVDPTLVLGHKFDVDISVENRSNQIYVMLSQISLNA